MTMGNGGHGKGWAPSEATKAKARDAVIRRTRSRGHVGYVGIRRCSRACFVAMLDGRTLGTYPTAWLAWQARLDVVLAPLAGDDTHIPTGGG